MQSTHPVARSLVLGVCLLGGLLAAEQAGTEVRGQVRGFANEPLAHVALIFRNVDRNEQRRLETDAGGAFAGQGFTAGRYRIAILQEERILWVVSGVELPAAVSPAMLDINLRDLRRAAKARPVLDAALQRRVREREAEQARRLRVRDHYRRGLRALEQQEYEEAVREWEAARELVPSEALYHAQLGQAYAGAGRTQDAVAAYQAALALEPDDASLRNNLGVALAQAGRIEEALATFGAAVRGADEQAATIYFNWGATLANAGRYAEAVKHFRTATRRDNADPMAFYFLGLSLFRTSPVRSEGGSERVKPRRGTVKAFRRYLELAPEGPYAGAAADYLKRLGAADRR
ncbi:MAG: tetratricopeptide repeat protein [Terriglobia bacterium]